MKLSDFDYYLPKNLIAQQPIKPRDHSRLLVIRRETTNFAHPNVNRNKTAQITNKYFYNIIDYLHKGDVLVLNNSKVMPARLIGRKIRTGGKIEVLLLKKVSPYPLQIWRGSPVGRGEVKGASEVWQCLVGNHGRREDLIVEFSQGLKAKILKHNSNGTWLVMFNKSGKTLMNIVKKIGQTPLPPYIKRKDSLRRSGAGRPFGKLRAGSTADSRNYQTVYASDKKVGSVAAPTAGLHFTPTLLKKIKAKGARIEYVTLHVGLGTFAPVKVDDITKHKMHAEWVEVSGSTIKRIVQAKSEGRRIIAVGTTSVRTLESIFSKFSIFHRKSGAGNFQFSNNSQIANKSQILNPKSKNKIFPPKADPPLAENLKSKITNYNGWINLFIYPGYKFKVVDGLITNFHLPESTLLMLVMAFAGKHNIDKAHKGAIKNKYRFYSYGDAMFIY